MKSRIIKNTLGGALGNAIEWYDFAIFGFSAPITAQIFVSASDKLNALIYVYALFAIGFISRPLGSILFGYIGDHYGRSTTLKLTVWFMSIPTVLIGLMPSYATLGMMTPILIALLRLAQGIAMGGEFTGSVIYLAEQAPPKHRGFFSSFGYMSTTSGILIGSAIVTLNFHLFSSQTILAWAWRIPFLFSIVLCLIVFYLRRHLPEPATKKAKTYNPILLAFKHNKRAMLTAMGLNFFNAVGFYTLFIFMVSYLTDILKINTNFALKLNTYSLVLLMLFIPVSGYLSDKFNRKAWLGLLTVVLLIWMTPAFWLLNTHSIIVTGKQLGRASCRERVYALV